MWTNNDEKNESERERKRKIVAFSLSSFSLSPSLSVCLSPMVGREWWITVFTFRVTSASQLVEFHLSWRRRKRKGNHYLDAVGCPNEKMYTYDQLDQSEPFISTREQWRETPVCSASRTRYYTCLMEKKRGRGMGNVLLSHSFVILWIHARKVSMKKTRGTH